MHISFLRRKSEAFDAFKKFKALVEVERKESKISYLRTDQGGEFCSKHFMKIAKKLEFEDICVPLFTAIEHCG